MLIHCKKNTSHCKINDICIAWMLIHFKNDTIHYKFNDICIVWMLIHGKTTRIMVKSMIYVYCLDAKSL